MSLQYGTRLGSFEILSLLGSGGMGEVYRARDTKLNRDVAIKTLPEGVATDPRRLARFQLEAQVLASLNHPNIAHIYGVEDSDGLHALVMELVEGPTLADRIAQGPIALTEALAIAAQIARALEAAHAQSVIHRDLKPANVKVRADGTVKVLDFGLAKALGPAVTGAPAGSSQLPTIASPAVTQVGAVLGTAAYMSPEQARGRVTGKPGDVWAFGCVLFEMLTGRSAFAGETMSDTIAKTLGQEPDWKALPASTPGRVREVLRRCLQKDEQQRFQDIRDARIDLEQAGIARGGWRRRAGIAVTAASFVAAVVFLARWYVDRPALPARVHPAMTVLIADLENRTNDPAFDRALEPVLRMSLESATFINVYDRTRLNSGLGIRPPDKLDENAALELAVKQGINAVVSGSIDRQGDGYVLSITATQAVAGSRLASATGRAANKAQILQTAATLIGTVRKALGDDASDVGQLFATTTLSATSLEAVREYAAAQDAGSNGRFDEALQHASKAVQLEPKFGIGYQVLAVASQNLGKREDAVRYINEALRHLDGMTERERLSTRGMFFRLTGDFKGCEKEYKKLSERYQGDVIGYNQRALCLVELHRMTEAVSDIRRAVEILPKRAVFRMNLALYSLYASDFGVAEREARTVAQQGFNRGWTLFVIGAAQQGRGLFADAASTYRELRTVGPEWASTADSGLTEIALYEGRFGDARKMLADGASAYVAARKPEDAAVKLAALADLEWSLGRRQDAIALTERALAGSQASGIRLAGARVLADLGNAERARAVADSLASARDVDAPAYARIAEAHVQLKNNNAREAIKLLSAANELSDTWIGHFDLGRAYLEDGQFAQADSEFDQCLKRRGETLLSDGLLLFAYLPSVHYYQGRAREGLKTEGFADSYRQYVEIRGKSVEDPFLADARARAGR